MIRVLEQKVADKIAAGEVVDKPLSVVKELVENAIDAGATAITVEIQKGGKTYIRVTDNGCGIDAKEVELAFQRHATSKISRADDLEHLETLGFRGEALASIAAVSRTEIITKTPRAKSGTKLLIDGGQVFDREPIGCPDGTTIVVRDLFYNMPARKEFLSSDASESRVIIEFLSQIALAYVNLRIRAVNNGAMLFSTQGKGDRLHNILTVYGKEISDNLIPVKAQEDYLQLEGYISSPGTSRSNRKHQIFFVNGRIVDSKVIQKGVSQAYLDKLFEGRFPAAFLFLRFRPDTLEVNIHPNKRQVRFMDDAFVTDFIRRALREALLSGEAIPSVKQKDLFKIPGFGNNQKKSATGKKEAASVSKTKEQSGMKTEPTPAEEQVDIKKLLSTIRREEENRSSDLKEDIKPYHIDEDTQSRGTENSRKSDLSYHTAPAAVPEGAEPADGQAARRERTEETGAAAGAAEQSFLLREPKTPPPFDFDQLTLLGTIFNTYIMAVDGACFYLIDQHAAHERIFFEKLAAQYEREEKHRQPLFIPIMLDISCSAAQGQEEWRKSLLQMGFLVEEFGTKTFVVKEIPMFMEPDEAERFLQDFTDSLADGARLTQPPVLQKIIMRSCKSAVKAHDHLEDSEIRHLIEELKKCENPFSCPHGRPTFIKMTQYQIEKMFKRV